MSFSMDLQHIQPIILSIILLFFLFIKLLKNYNYGLTMDNVITQLAESPL